MITLSLIDLFNCFLLSNFKGFQTECCDEMPEGPQKLFGGKKSRKFAQINYKSLINNMNLLSKSELKLYNYKIMNYYKTTIRKTRFINKLFQTELIK